nr:ribonuclease H-like domain-containing protein [Tanacetum cinerariifolium]
MLRDEQLLRCKSGAKAKRRGMMSLWDESHRKSHVNAISSKTVPYAFAVKSNNWAVGRNNQNVKNLNIIVAHPNGTVAQSSESNNDLRESNRDISGSKSQRPDVIPSDKVASDFDSYFMQQEAATFDEDNSTPIKENTFIQQRSCTFGGSRTYHLGGIYTSEDISDNVNTLFDDVYEDEDFGLFGNIFVSEEFAIRCIISLAASNSWPMFQLDINNAFLYRKLVEDVYMKLPEGYFDKNDNRVYVLTRSFTQIEFLNVSSKNKLKSIVEDKSLLGHYLSQMMHSPMHSHHKPAFRE